MRPALEYASSIWSPLASSTSINKLQVMQNTALRTTTGGTEVTNIHQLHDENTHTSHTSMSMGREVMMPLDLMLGSDGEEAGSGGTFRTDFKDGWVEAHQ